MGQEVLRLLSKDDQGQTLLAIQAMVMKRTAAGVGVVWCPGGIAGSLEHLSAIDLKEITSLLSLRFPLLRLAFHRQLNNQDKEHLERVGGKKALQCVSGELSMSYYPSRGSLEELQGQMKQNWRHNLKRSKKYNFRVELWENPSSQQIFELYQDLEKSKGIDQQYSEKEMMALCHHMSPYLRVYRALGENGELLGVRACTLLGLRAWDFLAAVGEEGRKCYASYALFWEMVQYCHKQNIVHYNFMGIDPINNPGVYNFKKGTGAVELQYLGEWDWGNFMLRPLFNMMLKYKRQ